MKKKIFSIKKSLILGIIICLYFALKSPGALAQFMPFPNPFFGFIPFGYVTFLPPLPTPPFIMSGVFRYANVPATTTNLFPAPTLPAVPAVTTGSVGVTTLIPTVQITTTVPASALITSPLSPLITYTPLSLVGLTYAPIPVTVAPAPLPLLLF